MEIDKLFTADRHEAGSEMRVNDQWGKPLDLYITMVGRDSKTWRTVEIELKRSSLAGTDPVEAQVDAMGRCALAWRGFEKDGEELEFSRESVTNLFISAPYVAIDADKYLSDRENFT